MKAQSLQCLLTAALLVNVSEGLMVDDTFLRCQGGFTSSGQHVDVSSVRSELECLSRCSITGACAAVNTCQMSGTDMHTCTLLGEPNSGGSCSGLDASEQSCVYMEKLGFQVVTDPPILQTTTEAETTSSVPETTPELVCENGGTPEDTHCFCPISHGGRTCGRLIRDCSEPYLNGYQGTSYAGVYLIQPKSSTAPFLVQCQMEYGGITHPFYRSPSSPTFNRDWATSKQGFGDDLNEMPDSQSFFIGLQRLHEILSQAKYETHIFMSWQSWANKGSAFYRNFTIGPESTGYALVYSSFFTTADHADNGLVDADPIVFSTQDNDIYGCATAKLAAGWYGTDCTAYSVFADTFLWPVHSVDTQIEAAMFSLVRVSDFYEP